MIAHCVQVKAAFTRAFNKEHHRTHYGIADAKKSRPAAAAVSTGYNDDATNEEEGSPDSEPESDSYSVDRMVKTKESSTASSSKAVKREGGGNGERGREGGGGGGGKGKGVAGKSHQKKGKTRR